MRRGTGDAGAESRIQVRAWAERPVGAGAEGQRDLDGEDTPPGPRQRAFGRGLRGGNTQQGPTAAADEVHRRLTAGDRPLDHVVQRGQPPVPIAGPPQLRQDAVREQPGRSPQLGHGPPDDLGRQPDQPDGANAEGRGRGRLARQELSDRLPLRTGRHARRKPRLGDVRQGLRQGQQHHPQQGAGRPPQTCRGVQVQIRAQVQPADQRDHKQAPEEQAGDDGLRQVPGEQQQGVDRAAIEAHERGGHQGGHDHQVGDRHTQLVPEARIPGLVENVVKVGLVVEAEESDVGVGRNRDHRPGARQQRWPARRREQPGQVSRPEQLLAAGRCVHLRR